MAVIGTSCYATLLDREVHYMAWSAPNAAGPGTLPPSKLMVMWHGLTRTGRDFDELASAVAAAGEYLVVCPDTIGRGLSQWSPTPEAEYNIPFYIQLAAALVDHLGFAECDWVGTSMGGLIGYIGAATALKGRIKRLLINDIGPDINTDGLRRIFSYSATPSEFDRFTDFEKFYTDNIFKDFGDAGAAYMRRTLEAYVRRNPQNGGKFTPHYDPAIIALVRKALMPADDEKGGDNQGVTSTVTSAPAAPKPDPWAIWRLVEAPVLVVRGAHSDLLLPGSLEKMIETHSGGPGACKSVVFDGCGHAPSLATPEQIAVVKEFFLL